MSVIPVRLQAIYGALRRGWMKRPAAASCSLTAAMLLFFVLGILSPLSGQAVAADAVMARVLSPEDAERYRQIFSLQAQSRIGGAASLAAEISDKRLMGHVLAQKYLHPTAYRASYQELKLWLDQYADHPDARQIHALALRKIPKGAPLPQKPLAAHGRMGVSDGAVKEYRPHSPRSRAAAQKVAAAQLHLKGLLKRKAPGDALEYLEREDIARLLDPVETDLRRLDIANLYFALGQDEKALQLGGEIAAHNARFVPGAHFVAGLAAWRLGQMTAAAAHFSAMSDGRSPYASKAAHSAAAFWAARAYLAERKPQQVNHYLKRAADHPFTMYGILAHRQLGLELPIDWRLPGLDPASFANLQHRPGMQRVQGLMEAGQPALAGKELRLLQARLGPEYDQQLFAFASGLKLPASHIHFAGGAGKSGKQWLSGLYPQPAWKPEGGFIIDPALIFAIIRKESNFATGAVGRGGTRGLMQLAPATARFISHSKAARGGGRQHLLDPEHNLALGQRYLKHLQSEDGSQDLFALLAAYNAGPGTLERWRKTMPRTNDPLLFLESLPSSRTRGYISRITADYWIYQHQMGTPLSSLDALAQGKWPEVSAPAATRPGKDAM